MANHGDNGWVVHQLAGDANRHIGTRAVVPDAQRELAAADAPASVDFLDGELGGALHRRPAGLGEWPNQPNDNRSPFATRTRRNQKKGGEEPPQKSSSMWRGRVRARLNLSVG